MMLTKPKGVYVLFSGRDRSVTLFYTLFVLLFTYPAISVYPHDVTAGDITKMVCHFTYPQGSSEVCNHLSDNAIVLQELDEFISSAFSDRKKFIRHIRLSGYSSIEGSYSTNERLAYERVKSFREYLQQHYHDLYRFPVDMVWVPEDWEGLSALVKASDINERKEVLDIIRRIGTFERRKALLMKLNGGRPYQKMAETVFPKLRRVEIEIEYTEGVRSSSMAIDR